ncbi:MAG: BrnT family toxin [Parvularculaceae bacterium]
MEYEWDERKAGKNYVKHGVPFETVELFEWDTALVVFDADHSAIEERWIALGLVQGRLHVLIYTERDRRVRVISLRKANAVEKKFYAEKTL